jgi:hypothetical protein
MQDFMRAPALYNTHFKPICMPMLMRTLTHAMAIVNSRRVMRHGFYSIHPCANSKNLLGQVYH